MRSPLLSPNAAPTNGNVSAARRRNSLLKVLSPEAYGFLQPYLEERTLSVGQVLYDEGVPCTHAVFPHEGVVSFVAVMADGRTAETTMIGREGFIGLALFLDGGSTVSRSEVMVAGSATYVPAELLKEAAERFPEIRSLVLKYMKALLVQSLKTVACNSLHRAEERCCRWILNAYDRVEGNRFYLKQTTLAEALGVRRATVGEVCSSLQQTGAMQYSRGWITVQDPVLLQTRACECYGKVRSFFERILPDPYHQT